MKLRAALTCTVGFALACPGCTDAPEPQGVLVWDSAGVTVIEHSRVNRDQLPEWSLTESPFLRIGTVHGSADLQFYRVQDAIRLANGSVAVIDLSYTLRLFSSAGNLLWTAGGAGDGPGEFRFPSLVREIAGDSLIVWDPVLRRLNVFTGEGAFVRDATFLEVEGLPTAWGLAGPRALLVQARRSERARIGGREALVHRSAFQLVNLDGTIVRDLGRRVFATEFQEVDEQGAFSPPIFEIAAVVAASPGGLWYGTTKQYELRDEVGPNQPRTIVRWQGPDRTVTDRDVEAVLADLMERLGDDPALRRRVIQYGDTHPRADRFPAYEQLRIDRDGHLWVQDHTKPHEDHGVRQWTVFTADGTRMVGRIAHPATLELYDIGADWVLAVERDEVDVEWIVLYELVRHH